jgi:hypothetical protein
MSTAVCIWRADDRGVAGLVLSPSPPRIMQIDSNRGGPCVTDVPTLQLARCGGYSHVVTADSTSSIDFRGSESHPTSNSLQQVCTDFSAEKTIQYRRNQPTSMPLQKIAMTGLIGRTARADQFIPRGVPANHPEHGIEYSALLDRWSSPPLGRNAPQLRMQTLHEQPLFRGHPVECHRNRSYRRTLNLPMWRSVSRIGLSFPAHSRSTVHFTDFSRRSCPQ